MMEFVFSILFGIVVWVLLMAFTALAWWWCAIIAVVLVILGFWIGPELGD